MAVAPEATAFQWVEPAMTLSHTSYFYTLSETDNSRTWMPVQDTPSVRVTYSAEVETNPKYMALMSAQNNPRSLHADGKYSFSMNIPIPPYLIAIATGNVVFRSTGPRTGIYSEPQLIDRAAREMSDMEKMLAAGEKIYGKYGWGRYDILFVPSFAYGGMENPLLTWGSTSLIVGDKSMVWLIGHEMCHSYTGNTVTNATWQDFWLNEGWTTYCEKRVAESVFGSDFAKTFIKSDFKVLDGLVSDLSKSDHPQDATLKTSIEFGRNPDDVISDIPYFRGEAFLLKIEELIGRQAFDQFARGYVQNYKFQSISTEEFIRFLKLKLGTKISDSLINAWVYKLELPPLPQVTAPSIEFAETIIGKIKQNPDVLFSVAETAKLKTLHYEAKRQILLNLPESFGQSTKRIENIRNALAMEEAKNGELQAAWSALAIKWDYTPDFNFVSRFLAQNSRLAKIKPVYQEIAATKNVQTHDRYMNEYLNTLRPAYAPIVKDVVDQVVGKKH